MWGGMKGGRGGEEMCGRVVFSVAAANDYFTPPGGALSAANESHY